MQFVVLSLWLFLGFVLMGAGIPSSLTSLRSGQPFATIRVLPARATAVVAVAIPVAEAPIGIALFVGIATRVAASATMASISWVLSAVTLPW